MIIHKESILRAKDGTKLYTQSWCNEGKPKAVVCIIHGNGGHSGRFEHWAKMFVNHNIAVSTFDLRGNGKSEGKRGHAPSYNTLINDVDIFYRATITKFRNIPLVIYGHSLGGNLAINYVLRKKPNIQGLVTSSPWLRITYKPQNFKFQLGKALRYIYPKFSFSSGLSEFDLSGSNNSFRKLNEDSLLHKKISVKLFLESKEIGIWALKNIYKINIPFIMMFGKDDKLTSYKACQEYIENAGPNTRMKIWESQGHNLHNNLGNLKIHQSIVQWMKENCIIADTKVKANEFIPH